MKATAGNKRKRSLFTKEEKAAIKEGASLFGFGKWKQIKEEYSVILQNRTVVQIKDQYRSMVQRNEVFSEKTSQPKQIWTPAEKAAVREGLLKHGQSSWSKIKDDSPCVLRNRTCLQIKDCVRTMFRSRADNTIVPNLCSADASQPFAMNNGDDSILEWIILQGSNVIDDDNSSHPELQATNDPAPEEQVRPKVESPSTTPTSARSKGTVLNEKEALPVVDGV